MSLHDKFIGLLWLVFVLFVIGGSYYQYKSHVVKESVDGLIKLNKDLEKWGWVRGIGVKLLKILPNKIVDKFGYYLFTIDVLLMIGSLFVSRKLLIIFGVRFLL